jgi:predicted ATPase
MARLPQPLQEVLQVACVEGQDFSAEVVARVLGRDERETVRQLSSGLDRRHRLIGAQALQVIGSRRVSRYRFRHSLFQKYLYDGLDQAERAYLHEDVGNVLEAWYGDQAEAIAVELARHFREARITDKAIGYLHQAGDRAVHLSAYEEGCTHLRQALELFKTLPRPLTEEERLQQLKQELGLQLSLGMALKARIPSTEGETALARARELCYLTGETTQLCRIVGELSIQPFVRAEYRKALELSEETLRLAQQEEDPLLVMIGHWHLGYIHFGLGEYARSRRHLRHVISSYDPAVHHRPSVTLRGSDPGVSALAYDACCLWCLGYPEQAEARSLEALALTRRLDHAFSLADVLCFAGCVFNELRRQPQEARDHGDELAKLSEKMGFRSFWGTGACYRGAALAQLGQLKEGISQMHEGLAFRESLDTGCFATGILGALAEAQAAAGIPEDGLVSLSQALRFMEETDERYCAPELHRIEGQLRLMIGDEGAAEASYQKAIAIARRMEARSWELRAATDLAKLWQSQGRAGKARELLAGIYGWFTEGFDTPDFQAAKAVLGELDGWGSESRPGFTR